MFEADKKYIPMINEYIKTYKSSLFTSDVIEFFRPQFRVCDTDNPFKYIYGIYSIENLNTDCILPSTFKIDVSSIKEGMTEKFDNYYSKNMNSDFIYFGTIINNDEIVSLVNTEPNELNFKAMVLSCETLPEYRSKGYAKSNTAAITKYLLENDYEVITLNGTNNIESVKTVESLGF